MQNRTLCVRFKVKLVSCIRLTAIYKMTRHLRLNEQFVSIRAGIRIRSVLAHDEGNLVPHVLVVNGPGALKVHSVPGEKRLFVPERGGTGFNIFEILVTLHYQLEQMQKGTCTG